ncbi:MAG: glycosyltransferase family 2 protein, partial [Clostridium sp.]
MNGSIDVSIDTLNNIKAYSNIILKENIKFTSIVILTYNQLEYTKLCIESIRIFTPKNSYEIIIVDNNSTDGTCD